MQCAYADYQGNDGGNIVRNDSVTDFDSLICPGCGREQRVATAGRGNFGHAKCYFCRVCGWQWTESADSVADAGGDDDWRILEPIDASGWHRVYSPSRNAEGTAYFVVCGGLPMRTSEVEPAD
jgi:hypothetical protein